MLKTLQLIASTNKEEADGIALKLVKVENEKGLIYFIYKDE